MIKETRVVTNNECYSHNNHAHVSWTAILAGGLVGVGLGFLLHLFGIAIGLSAYSSTPDGATTIAIGGILGLLVGTIVSMGIAGYVAGYLGRFHYCYCHGGLIYGFVTWSVALVLSAALVMPLGNYITAYRSTVAPVLITDVAPSDTNSASNVEEKVVANKPAPKVTTTDLAWYGWIVFILFFVGAISSCVGACWGMMCNRDENHYHPHVDVPPTKL